MPSSPCTPTWPPATVPVSGPSTYVEQGAWYRKARAALLTICQILRVVEIEKTADIKRPYIKQLLTKNLKFPLPHRITKTSTQKLFSAKRPSTFA